jgi:hypothetical protein
LLFLVSVAMSIILLIKVSITGSNIWNKPKGQQNKDDAVTE